MKVLTLTQPWATSIALGYKQHETRSWRTNYRGPIAIHAAKGFPRWARDFAATERALGRLPGRLPLGAIIATANLVAIWPAAERAPDISALDRYLGDYSPGRWAWELADVHLLTEPIFCKGALGLREFPDNFIRALGERAE